MFENEHTFYMKCVVQPQVKKFYSSFVYCLFHFFFYLIILQLSVEFRQGIFGCRLWVRQCLIFIDLITTSLFQFLYDYYGPQMYDRYTTRYDPYSDLNSMNNMNSMNSALKLKATTAKEYYGFAKSFHHSGFLESLTSGIMSLISNAQHLYSQ